VQWLNLEPTDWILREVAAECEFRLVGCSREEASEALELTVQMMRCTRPSEFVWAGYLNIMTMFARELLMPSIRVAIAAERYHVLPTVGALVHHAKVETELRRDKVLMLKRAITRLELRQFYDDRAGERSRASRVRGSAAPRAGEPGCSPPPGRKT
jgi:hypothetical protein